MLILILMMSIAGTMSGGLLALGLGWPLWAASSSAILGGMAGTLLGGALNLRVEDALLSDPGRSGHR